MSYFYGYIKNQIYCAISDKVPCPSCADRNKAQGGEIATLLIGQVSFEEDTVALFCIHCDFRAAIPIIIFNHGRCAP